MENLKKRLQLEIPEFSQVMDRFLSGELSKMEFKKQSGGFGVYAHRNGKEFMLRLRILSGILTKDQLKLVYDMSEKHHVKLIHLTTRQAIQLHYLSKDDVIDIISHALEHGIYTRGGGGNYPRNIAISPRSGVDPDEAFDIVPYANVCNQYFMERITSYKLPRKFKVSFSNTPQDSAHVTVQDLGFMAYLSDGKPYFRVYGGGGLGKNPKTGLVLGDKVDPSDVLYYLEAMVQLFVAEGNYENPHKARIRYIVDELGEDVFIQKYNEYVASLKAEGHLDVMIKNPYESTKQSTETFEHESVLIQKQAGLYSVYFHPVGGQVTLETLKRIVDYIEPIQDVEMRLAMTEGLYFVNLTASEAKGLLEIIKTYHATTSVERSVACIGVPICQMGIASSQEALQSIVNEVKTSKYLPTVYISGCPNSCGVHQIGSIGLMGKLKKVEGTSVPCYEVFMNGCVHEGEVRLGVSQGDVTAEQLPSLLVSLSEKLEELQVDFKTCLETSKQVIMDILEPYRV